MMEGISFSGDYRFNEDNSFIFILSNLKQGCLDVCRKSGGSSNRLDKVLVLLLEQIISDWMMRDLLFCFSQLNLDL